MPLSTLLHHFMSNTIAEYYRRQWQVASLVLTHYMRAGRATPCPTYNRQAGVLSGPA